MTDPKEAAEAARWIVANVPNHTRGHYVARAYLDLERDYARMREALRAFGFGTDIEEVGWRGSLDEDGNPLQPGSAFYHCEFCYRGNIDCALIAHTDDCPVILARSALNPKPASEPATNTEET